MPPDNSSGGAAVSSAIQEPSGEGEPRSSPTPGSPVQPGSKYRLLAEIGRGGMANVYLAVARGPSGFNKLVVLKCLRSDLAHDRDQFSMFLDEARLAARLNHPHVVQTYEVSEYVGYPVIVMEYLEGQVLANLMQRAEESRALPLALHLRIIVDALDGLHYAHELADYDGTPLNLVHRDISPRNIFITFEGQVKVLDFGIAKAATSQSQTATGVLKGTVKYMAPEQMLGGRVDRRADVYSMGVLLWEAATGQRMWKGMSDIQVMNRVANEGGQPLSEIGAAVDPELAAIVRKALDDDPERRFATARELAAAIEPLIEGTGTGTGTTNRALGVLMRELFDDVRQQARVLIESQLQEVRTDGADPAFIPPDIVQLSPRAQGSGELPMSSSRSNVGTTNSSKPRPSLKREVVLFSVMGAAIVGMVALLAVRRDSRGDDASAASALAPSAAAGLSPADPSASGAPAAEPPEAKTVSLEITSNPPSAIVFLDGRRLPVNPYSGSLPQDGATHEVRVEATGFETRTLKLTADRDTHLVVALDAAPSPRAALPTKPAPSARSAPSASAAPAIDKNCTPPFVIDAAGIKKFKPECL